MTNHASDDEEDSAPESDEVVSYYETGVEAERLAHTEGVLEFARTKELILRYLQPQSTVADVGGGVGIYADWLTHEGHRVELVEPVREHVDRARQLAGVPASFGVHLGDARHLPLKDESFDAAMLLGPLYHLGERDDRRKVIEEALRVCKSGGVIFAAAICRYAGLFKMIRTGALLRESVLENVLDEVRSGRRVPASRRNSPFPDAYFHLPEELRAELEEGGVVVDGVFGIEGPGMLLSELESQLEDSQVKARLLRVAREVEADPRLMTVSAHLLGVGRKT
jgi:SAM-dependent methyltransferase